MESQELPITQNISKEAAAKPGRIQQTLFSTPTFLVN